MAKRPRLDTAKKERIVILRTERSWSYRRIATELNLSPGAVSWHCLMAGIEKPGTPPPDQAVGPMVVQRGNHVVRRFSDAEDRRILDLDEKGVPPLRIARQLGRKRNSVVARMATLARRDERRMVSQEAGS